VGVNAAGVTTTNNFNTSIADNTEATITAYSFFIQDEIAINDYVDVVLGGRFDSFKIDVDDLANNEVATVKPSSLTVVTSLLLLAVELETSILVSSLISKSV